jgi:TRAP-type C4-dicarboxylate transport system permease large subunit
VLPLVEAAGLNLIWFGIFIVLLVEIAQITPPVGFNLFVLQNMARKDIHYIAGASIPFFLAMLAAIAVITAFPQIVTWLPDVVLGAGKK